MTSAWLFSTILETGGTAEDPRKPSRHSSTPRLLGPWRPLHLYKQQLQLRRNIQQLQHHFRLSRHIQQLGRHIQQLVRHMQQLRYHLQQQQLGSHLQQQLLDVTCSSNGSWDHHLQLGRHRQQHFGHRLQLQQQLRRHVQLGRPLLRLGRHLQRQQQLGRHLQLHAAGEPIPPTDDLKQDAHPPFKKPVCS